MRRSGPRCRRPSSRTSSGRSMSAVRPWPWRSAAMTWWSAAQLRHASGPNISPDPSPPWSSTSGRPLAVDLVARGARRSRRRTGAGARARRSSVAVMGRFPGFAASEVHAPLDPGAPARSSETAEQSSRFPPGNRPALTARLHCTSIAWAFAERDRRCGVDRAGRRHQLRVTGTARRQPSAVGEKEPGRTARAPADGRGAGSVDVGNLDQLVRIARHVGNTRPVHESAMSPASRSPPARRPLQPVERLRDE